DVFDRGDLTARAGGAGLGLAISRSYARLMSGDLVVRSVPGRGSLFTFSFEAGDAAAADVRQRHAHPVPTGLDRRQPSPKVLIVDDVLTNRELLDELLSQVGFVSRSASSAEEAIAAHDEWRPDLILMDLRMPGMSGLEAIKTLRLHGSSAAIIAVT